MQRGLKNPLFFINYHLLPYLKFKGGRMKDIKILKTSYGVNLTIVVKKSPKTKKVMVYVLELPFILVEDDTLILCKERILKILDIILDDFFKKEMGDITL
jgi:5'(3')-deoxyribonucleotidase